MSTRKHDHQGHPQVPTHGNDEDEEGEHFADGTDTARGGYLDAWGSPASNATTPGKAKESALHTSIRRSYTPMGSVLRKSARERVNESKPALEHSKGGTNTVVPRGRRVIAAPPTRGQERATEEDIAGQDNRTSGQRSGDQVYTKGKGPG